MIQNNPKKNICFYFQVHQPYRLQKYSFFDIGEEEKKYFDDHKNKEIFRKVAKKCYLPTNKLMLKLLKRHPEFKISYSLSGVFLDQCEEYGLDVLESFKKLAKTGQVEFLCETYYHSLSFLYSKLEFTEQVIKHYKKIKKLFKYTPQVFRNTELIYNNELGNFINKMGFKGILAEGADHILYDKSPNYLYKIKKAELPEQILQIAINNKIIKNQKEPHTKLLLKNYKLSDDIAFRFSNQNWESYPLTADKFSHWITQTNGDTINLFMDYETFGEHQWEDTGIFNFLEYLPDEFKNNNISFHTPSEAINNLTDQSEIDMHHPVSWADMERDLSAWLGNEIQETTMQEIFNLEKIFRNKQGKFKKQFSKDIINTWRKLQTSDQFYYMCTKYWNDGDVHKYFSPYDSPYEAYIIFMNVLSDFKLKIKQDYSLIN